MAATSTNVMPFSKYQGSGNDFIMIWDPEKKFKTFMSDPAHVKKMCHRYLGIGADAVMYMTKANGYDYAVEDYTIRNGTPSRLCGNGSRCSVSFAKYIGAISGDSGTFLACDGAHNFNIEADGSVNVQFADVLKKHALQFDDDNYFIDVGSPQHMKFVDDIKNVDVMQDGKALCYSERYNKPDETGNVGANINFVQKVGDDTYRMRTYERTSDTECPACGTGSVGTALSVVIRQNNAVSNDKKQYKKRIVNNGGTITVSFTVDEDRFGDVVMNGPTGRVFDGAYLL